MLHRFKGTKLNNFVQVKSAYDSAIHMAGSYLMPFPFIPSLRDQRHLLKVWREDSGIILILVMGSSNPELNEKSILSPPNRGLEHSVSSKHEDSTSFSGLGRLLGLQTQTFCLGKHVSLPIAYPSPHPFSPKGPSHPLPTSYTFVGGSPPQS